MKVKFSKRNPYPGPRFFEQEEQKLFFGRDREGREILSLIIAHKVVLLYAQSGAGKTSLLNAKLIPLLKEENFEVLPVARVRGFEPKNVDIKEVSNIYVFNTLMDCADDKVTAKSLLSMSINTFLKDRKHLTDEDGLQSPRIAIFDQFEELFTFYPERWKEREGFFRQVAEALDADPLLRVLFIIREDYLADMDPYVEFLPEQLRTRYRMERLRRRASCLAVEGPLRNTGRSFAKEVVSKLVKQLLTIRVESTTGETVEVAGEYVEPVQLQVVCQNLWNSLPKDVTVITSKHIQTFGDVDEALECFYEGAVKTTVKKTGVKDTKLRSWFGRKLITPAGTRGTVYRGQKETGGIPNEAVNMLENIHIIRAEPRGGAHWYELTHDRFLHPIQSANQKWLGRLPEAEQTHQHFETKANEWVRLGKGSSGLLDEVELLEAERWRNSPSAVALGYSESIDLLVAASKAAVERKCAEEQRRRAEEKDRSARRFKRLTVALVVVSVVAILFFLRALRLQKLADTRAALADSASAEAVYSVLLKNVEKAKAERQKGYAEKYAAKAETERERAEQEALTARLNESLAYAARAYESGYYGEAQEILNKIIEENPQFTSAYQYSGLAHRGLADYDNAVKAFQEAIKIEPDDWTYAQLGATYRLIGEYDKAITNLERAISLKKPQYAWPYQELGLAYKDVGNYGNAIKAFQEAIEINPYDGWTYALLGRAYRLNKDNRQAIDNLKEATYRNPQDTLAHRELGLAYKDVGDYGNAIKAFQEAIKIEPDEWTYAQLGEVYWLNKMDDKAIEVYRTLGQKYQDSEDYDNAIKAFQEAIKIEPDEWTYAQLGETHRLNKEYQQAITNLKKAVSLNSHYAWAYRELGHVYKDSEDYDNAIKAFQKAIRIDSTHAWSYAQLGETYRLNKEYDKAIVNLEQAIHLDTQYIFVYQVKGLTYIDSGDYRNAIKTFQEAIRIDSTHAWNYVLLGETYRLNKEYDKAIVNLEQAIHLDLWSASPYTVLGLVYKDSEDYDNAIKAFQEAIKIEPDEWTYAQLGFLYNEFLFEYELAYDCFKKALEINPDDLSFRTNFIEANFLNGRFKDAHRLAKDILAESDTLQTLDLDSRSAMEFFMISSLVLQGHTAEAHTALEKFIIYYKSVVDDYEPGWSYNGSKHFITQREMDESQKEFLLKLIDILETPTPDITIEQFKELF